MFHVIAQNFLSFKDLDIDFNNRGLVLIEGKNGAGKSSILEALAWGLYGESTKSGSPDQVVNKQVGKDCSVQVEFGDYKIIRYRKHTKYKNELYLYFKEENITKKSSKDTQAQIETIIGLNFKSFLHSIYFSQNNLNKFTSASDSEQKSIVENILGLELISVAQELSKAEVKKIATEIDVKNGDKAKQRFLYQDVEKTNLDLQNKQQEFELNKKRRQQTINQEVNKEETNHKALLQKIESIQRVIDNIDGVKAALLQKKNAVEEEKRNYILQLELPDEASFLQIQNKRNQKQQERFNIGEKIKELTQNKNKLEQKIQQKEFEIKSYNKQIEDVRADIAKISKQLESKICPTCRQTIVPNIASFDFSDHEKKIKRLEEQIEMAKAENFAAEIQTLSQQISLHSKEIEVIQGVIAKIDEMERLVNNNKQKLLSFDIQAQTIDKDIANQDIVKAESEKKIVATEHEINICLLKIETLKKTIDDIENEVNPYIEQLISNKEKLSKIAEDIEKIELGIANLNDEKKYYDYWVDGFSNQRLKSFIMDTITPLLNEKTNFYVQHLIGSNFQIEIDTQTTLKSGETRDKFSINIYGENGANYELSSGGEKKRIDLCILFALQELAASRANIPLNLLILDECSENLDSSGVENMVELLCNIISKKQTVLYVTHNESMQTFFPERIQIVKHNNISHIYSGE